MFVFEHILSQQHFCQEPPHKQRASVLLLDLFLATPVSSAWASLHLPNTGTDPKLTGINRRHFCELHCNSWQTCSSEKLLCFSCLPKMKQAAVIVLESWAFSWRHTFSALTHLPGERWFCQICYTCSVGFLTSLTSLCLYKVGISLSQVRRGWQIDPVLCGFKETKLLVYMFFYQQSNITYFILFTVSRMSRAVNKCTFKAVSVDHKPASFDFNMIFQL